MIRYSNKILSVLLFFSLFISCSKDEPTDTNPIIEPELTFSVENLNGVSFDDNEVVSFNSTEYPEASLDFLVRNISNEIIEQVNGIIPRNFNHFISLILQIDS